MLSSTDTIADSISVAAPAAGELALRALRDTAGRAVEVRDDEILAAQRELAAESGCFVEPSSAVPLAALIENKSLFNNSRIGIILTGGNVDLDRLPF